MLNTLIVIDYAEGAGGEYFANMLNSHQEFNSAAEPLATSLQQVKDYRLKWFNSNSLIHPDWSENIKSYTDQFLKMCSHSYVEHIAVPYHLYRYPKHQEVFKTLSKNTKFISIDCTPEHKLVNQDYIRKILFQQLTKKDIHTVSYLSKNCTDSVKNQLIDLLKHEKLYGIDLELARSGQDLSDTNRKQLIDKILTRTVKTVANDLVIGYKDFFVSFDITKEKYYNLCKDLNINPNDRILSAMIERNKKNFESLQEFSNNFDSIMNQILTTCNQGTN